MAYQRFMAKKQTRRSISVSRPTYERLKSYCETNQISMSQFVEKRVGDFLGRAGFVEEPDESPATSPTRDPDVKVTPDSIFTF